MRTNLITTFFQPCEDECSYYRPESLGADAFRGHGLNLLEKPTLRGLRTRAFPAGVTAPSDPELLKLYDAILAIAGIVIISKPLTSSGRYTETPVGGKHR